jgi:hypothetical protein
MSTGIHEVDRREIFSQIVQMQDRGSSVGHVRASITQEFGISTETVLDIETEGIAKQWPPLNESLVDGTTLGEEF